MGYEIRTIAESETEDYRRVSTIAFGQAPTELEDPQPAPDFEYDRTRCAFDGDRMVGVSRAISFDITVPGSGSGGGAGVAGVRASGIADVGVLPTHRRRGVLTAMMAELVADASERGEPVALLTASEGGIYGRFGFGVAVQGVELELTKLGAEVVVPDDGGSVSLLPAVEARPTIVSLFEQTHPLIPGDVDRHGWWWDNHLTPKKGQRLPLIAVRTDPSGAPDGYVSYGLQWQDGGRNAQLRDFVALTPAAAAGLWRFLIGIDLVSRVTGWSLPADLPVRWMLNDPRKARIKGMGDALWARLVDVGAALAARGYACDGELTIALVDSFLPANDGVWRLETATAPGTAATCTRVPASASPDVTLDAAALGATWLGGTSWTALHTAGRVVEHTPGALARADAMFSTARPPHNRTGF